MVALVHDTAYMQFPDKTRLVSRVAQIRREHFLVLRQNIKEIIHTVSGYCFTRHHACAARRTYGSVAISVIVYSTVAPKRVKIRRTCIPATVNSKRVSSLLIGRNKQYVWFIHINLHAATGGSNIFY